MALATPGLDREGQPTRIPLASPDAAMLTPDFGGEHMLVNIGPQHPATHGVLRLVVELEGEKVRRCIPHIGYLHSGFEKLGEYRHYNQIIPLTDRTDYLSPMANNVCLALAAEKLMGIEITERCQVLRVIACEMSRIISHLVWLGTTGIDLGAFTPFLWSFQERERIYNLQEAWTGARLTTSLTRVGGMMADIPEGFEAGLREFCRTFPKTPRGSGHDVHPERHLDRADPGCRALSGRGGDQLLALRADAPRQRGGLRRPEGPPLPGLRDLRFRRADRRARRHLRSLPGPARGDVPVEPDPGAGARPAGQAQGRADQRGRSAGDPSAQVAGDERHGGDDLPLQAGDGRGEAAGR